MPRKGGRARTLFLNVRIKAAPERYPLKKWADPVMVLNRLIASVEDGSYRLPAGWDIMIQWKNGADKPWKVDNWTRALVESAKSSTGFEQALLSYLYAQIERYQKEMGR